MERNTKRIPLVLCVLLMFALMLQACADNTAPMRSLTAIGDTDGRIVVNGTEHRLPWSGQLAHGSSVTLLAIPPEGYTFDAWAGDLIGGENPFTFTLTKNTRIEALFSQSPRLVVTPESRDFGSVRVGETRELSFVVANLGGGALAGTATSTGPFELVSGSAYLLASGESQSVRVAFAPTTVGVAAGTISFSGPSNVTTQVTGTGVPANTPLWALSVLLEGPATVTSAPAGIDCPGACDAVFPEGTQVTLTPAMAEGAEAIWSGCDAPAGDGVAAQVCTLTLGSDRSVSLVIEEEDPAPSTATLTVAVTGQGSVVSAPAGINCPGSCSTQFPLGTNVTLTPNVNPNATTVWTGCDSPSNGAEAAVCSLALGSDRGVTLVVTEAPVLPNVTVSVSPSSISAFTDEAVVITATVTGSADTRVTWSAEHGTISGSGNTISYTAPSNAGTYDVVATSLANPSRSGTARVNTESRRVIQLAAGDEHTLALKNDGTVWAWGANAFGQLGDGTTTNRLSAVQVPALFNIVKIAAGSRHSLAVRADGTLFAWGDNTEHQTSWRSDTAITTPQAIGLPYGRAVDVAAGFSHSLAVTEDGRVYAWGYNRFGQLGDGTLVDKIAPTSTGLSGVTAISAGYDHSIAIDTAGDVYVWGRNDYGRLGARSGEDCGYPYYCLPSPFYLPGIRGRMPAGGGFHTLISLGNGGVMASGWNLYGQLGEDSADICTGSPGSGIPEECSFDLLQISRLSSIQAVAAGGAHSAAIAVDGTLYTWGANGNGQLGVTSSDTCYSGGVVEVPCARYPNEVSALAGVVAVATGGIHTVAALSNGTVWAWGANGSGQLGTGSTVSSGRPVMIHVP